MDTIRAVYRHLIGPYAFALTVVTIMIMASMPENTSIVRVQCGDYYIAVMEEKLVVGTPMEVGNETQQVRQSFTRSSDVIEITCSENGMNLHEIGVGQKDL